MAIRPPDQRFNFDINALPKNLFGRFPEYQYDTAGSFGMWTWQQNPIELLQSIVLEGVKVPPGPFVPDATPLPCLKFSDFGVSGDDLPEECRDREYISIVKKWTDGDRKFELTYAIARPSLAPFKSDSYNTHIPLVIMTIHPVSNEKYPHEHTWTLSGEICLQEPSEEVLTKGHIPETHVFFQFQDVVFSPDRRTRVVLCSPKVEKHYAVAEVQLRDLPKSLALFHSNFHHQKYAMAALIRWEQMIIWRPNLDGILHVLRIPELLELTCQTLDMHSLQSLRGTCKYFAKALISFLSRRLRKGLLRVFGDAQHLAAFQVLLRTTETIVGGSFPLSLLCPGDWEPGDLDIVVREAEADRVRRFLVHQCQFLRDDKRSRGVTDNGFPYPDSDSKYEHFANPVLGRPGIDLVTMYNKPGLEKSYPANFILAYHSTVVMNFWNGKHLYCMWPNLTFKGLYVRNLEELTPKLVDALEKYQERGFLDKYDPHGLRAIYGATPHYIQDDLGEVRHEMHQLKVSDIPGPRWRMLAEV